MSTTVEIVRKRAWHSLSPDTAAAGDMSVAQLQQFLLNGFTPSQEQIAALARHFGIREERSS
jgi:hypothetical protein